MKPTSEGVAMTETKRKNEPQPATWFRKIVAGTSLLSALRLFRAEPASPRH